MKKLLFASFLFLGIYSLLSAQNPMQGGAPGNFQRGTGPSITGKISGTLVDSTTNTPVEFATVVVVNPSTGKQLDGGITDDKGEFKLPDVRLGTYELHFSFLGYQNKVISGIELTPEKPDFEAGRVFITPEGVTLNEVQVTGQAAVVENRIDKLVYNADKDVTSMGGDASNVLQKVPLLSVDSEGNVSLRGSSNIQILINGKPSTIFSTNAADALKTIPADQIKSVEVITNPTAKFDGEGSGGIINIITKKKNAEGFTGSINATVGNRSNRGSLNLNLTRGRFGLNFSGNGWYGPSRPSYNDYLRIDQVDGQERTLEQHGDGESENFGPRGNLGMFYDINAYNNISSSIGFRGFGRNSESVTDAIYLDPTLNLNQDYTRTSSVRSFNSGFDWNTDYKRTFKKPDQEFTLGFQLDMDFSDSENAFDQAGNDVSLLQKNINQNLGINSEITLQADYAHPISKAIKLETGAKSILRQIDSDFSYDEFDFTTNQYIRNSGASDVFYYDQNVYAGYLSFNIKLGKKYGMVVGSRYEHTEIGGDYDFNETTFSNSYGNFLPSLILSHNLNQFSSIKLSYNQRIRRPGLNFVNPYVNLSDPRDVTVGNPELLPEVTNQFEVNYGTYVKGIVVNTSVFYRLTNDNIESFLEIGEDGISRNTFRNIGQSESIGASMFSSVNIKDKLTLRGSATVSTYNVEGIVNGEDLSRTSVVWNGNLNGTLTLKKGFKIEAFGFYNSPRQSIQGSRASYSMFSFGLLKEFSKQFTMGLNISQPFQEYRKFKNTSEGTNFFQESTNGFADRSIGLNITYRFGKLEFKDRNNGKGERNNDLMKGDDEGQGGGGTRNGGR
ncbi:MAG: TonB-dependent receptor [Saprospiraceae bacterium]|nr:TonB-dependent receptor [Saprospiraceae bacterium]